VGREERERLRVCCEEDALTRCYRYSFPRSCSY